MNFFFGGLAACGVISKEKRLYTDEDASEIQLNAFEFRNYRTRLDPDVQKTVERIVNQWCSMLVKGKTMKVNNFEEKVMLDKDLLHLEYGGDLLPLKNIRKMEFFKEAEELAMDSPYGLDLTFEGTVGDTNLSFTFEHERTRLSFALTLRILRTRDPTLEPSRAIEVIGPSEEEDEERRTFTRLATAPRYKPDLGIPVVISVSDLKIYTKLACTSRQVYLELFVRYPSQDKFLYAKSPTTPLPPQVLLTEDTFAVKAKSKSEAVDEEEAKKEEAKKILGQDLPICALRLGLKNVKLKIPKTPHTILGRLMARDDYFPTTVGTFEFEVKKAYLQDRRIIDPAEKRRERNGRDDGSRTEPETLAIPVLSPSAAEKEIKVIKVGLLTLRLLGYITDDRYKPKEVHLSSGELFEEGEEEELLEDWEEEGLGEEGEEEVAESEGEESALSSQRNSTV